MKNSIYILTFACSLFIQIKAQTHISKFNNLPVNIYDSIKTYKILVTAHLHGSSYNKSGFPASSLLANLDLINTGNYAFMVCLGDLFMNPETDIHNYEKSFFSKINIPLFNAVGNHDIYNNIYNKLYGNTFFSFTKHTEKFIFLDTEINNGNIQAEQLRFLKQELTSCNTIHNILIFMHRPLWAENHPEMKNLFKDNTRSLFGTNYFSDIQPLLKNLPANINLFLFAGSMGTSPASFFYHKENNITYIATAIRDLPRDAFLEVIFNNSSVSFNTLSINGNPVKPLEEYNLNYYNNNNKSEPFSWKLLPLYIKNIVLNSIFWYGFLSAVLILLLILYTIKYRNKIAKQ